MVGKFVKAKLGELEEDIMEGNSRILRKDMNGMVQEVAGKRRYSVRFQDGGGEGYVVNLTHHCGCHKLSRGGYLEEGGRYYSWGS